MKEWLEADQQGFTSMAELGVGEGKWKDDNQFLEMRNRQFGRFRKLSIGSEVIHMVAVIS